MKFFVSTLLSLVGSFSFVAQAADSAWLLCHNDQLVVNAFEHRASGGENRVLSLAMVYGSHTLTGAIQNSEGGLVALKDLSREDSVFNGGVTLNFENKTLAVHGALQLGQVSSRIDAVLNCIEMGR